MAFATIVMIGHTHHGNGRHHDGGDISALSASRIARAFITVASMPMWSPVTLIHARSTQGRATEQVAATDHQTDLNADTDQLADFSAMRSSTWGSMPNSSEPMRASPLSLVECVYSEPDNHCPAEPLRISPAAFSEKNLCGLFQACAYFKLDAMRASGECSLVSTISKENFLFSFDKEAARVSGQPLWGDS